MKNKLKYFIACVLLLLSVKHTAASPLVNSKHADVVIYGATPAGIMAAVAIKQSGLKPLIIEPTKHIGGIMTSGLGASDHCNPRIVGGLARDFFKNVGTHYGKKILWRFEPHIGQTIFNEYVDKYSLTINKQEQVTEVKKTNGRISSITTSSNNTYTGKFFIDASYEGDLMARAGVSYNIGRESREIYDEADAGIQPPIPRHQFPVLVSAYDQSGKLLPGISEFLPEFGTGDDKTMAYNFRLCMTKKEGNFVPVPKPTKYNEQDYELLARWLEKQPNALLKHILLFLDIPNGKYDINNNGPFSTDYIGANWNYPEASYAERQKIIDAHADYTKGLFYFLRTSSRVPSRIRNLMTQFGLCKDEFQDNNNWPPLLYVRVARRMLGSYVLNQNDMDSSVKQSEAVALAACPIESHSIQRVALNGHVINEGWAAKRVTPYQLPYSIIVPKSAELNNLIVPVAVSASHIAYSSLRMEPVFMSLGEVAGLATVQAFNNKQAVQDISVPDLQATIRSRKIRIFPPGRNPKTG